MIRVIDPADLGMAARIVEIQRAAYAVEAALIGFDGIPQMHETPADVIAMTSLCWRGAFVENRLVAVIAWTEPADTDEHDVADGIDRLAVDPAVSRRGHGRALVQSVPTKRRVTVSTGEANAPAVELYLSEGFARTHSAVVGPGIAIAHFERPGG